MKGSLKYGQAAIELEVPDELWASHERFDGERRAVGAPEPAEGWVGAALDELDRSGFEEAVRDRILGLLVSDGTRERTFERFLEPLARRLRAARAMRVFICTGTHDPDSPENRRLALDLRARLDAVGLFEPHCRVIVHDSRRARFTAFGETSRGTRIEIHEALGECDAFLVLANMKNHYFAGYSNPVKYFVPGVAAYETARGNHSLTLEEDATFGRHPWHPREDRRRNPLAEDMVEAFERVLAERLHFALVVVGSSEHLAWAGGGRTRDATARGMTVVDRVAALELEPVRFLVVSPGGSPHDESLYTAQRALELSRAAVLDGGEVLFLARCPNGIGPASARENFFEPLCRPLDDVCRLPRTEYVMYSHKSYKFGHYLRGLTAVHVTSDLVAGDVRSAHMHPTRDPQAVIDRWVAQAGPNDRLRLIDDASRFAVHAAHV